VDEKMVEETVALYQNDDEDKLWMQASEKVKADIGFDITRIESIIGFARYIGAKKIGVVSCSTTLQEAAAFCRIMEAKGFSYTSVICKVGGREKDEIGIPGKQTAGRFRAMCNPILQAKFLEKEKTDLNVMMGLCVGHDTPLFQIYQDPHHGIVHEGPGDRKQCVQPLYLLDSFPPGFLRRRIAPGKEHKMDAAVFRGRNFLPCIFFMQPF
jgi:uncharacterized metal-binding protein